MQHFHSYIKYIAFTSGCMLIGACGGDTVGTNENGDSANSPTSFTPVQVTPPSPAPEGQFNILRSSPVAGSSTMQVSDNILLTFEEPVFTATVNDQTVQLLTGNRVVPIDIQYAQGSSELVINPKSDLLSNTQYELRFSDALMSEDGDTLAQKSMPFKTAGDMGDTPETVAQNCMTQEDIEMLQQINTARSQSRSCGSQRMAAVPPVGFDCTLKQAARRHSLDMARTGNFDHIGTDGSEFSDRIRDTGYVFNAANENIAVGQRTVTEVMQDPEHGWLNSPGHCRNIMSASVTEVGTSMELNQNGRRYWTQNFARPR